MNAWDLAPLADALEAQRPGRVDSRTGERIDRGAAIDAGLLQAETALAVGGDLGDLPEILIGAAVDARRLAEESAAPWKAREERAKSAIAAALAASGTGRFQTARGSATQSKGYTRVDYKAASLDVLCRDDEELARRLAPYRTESEIAGSLIIRGK